MMLALRGRFSPYIFHEMCPTARVHHVTPNMPTDWTKQSVFCGREQKSSTIWFFSLSLASVSLAGFLDTLKPPTSSAQAATTNVTAKLSQHFPLAAKTLEYNPGFNLISPVKLGIIFNIGRLYQVWVHWVIFHFSFFHRFLSRLNLVQEARLSNPNVCAASAVCRPWFFVQSISW